MDNRGLTLGKAKDAVDVEVTAHGISFVVVSRGFASELVLHLRTLGRTATLQTSWSLSRAPRGSPSDVVELVTHLLSDPKVKAKAAFRGGLSFSHLASKFKTAFPEGYRAKHLRSLIDAASNLGLLDVTRYTASGLADAVWLPNSVAPPPCSVQPHVKNKKKKKKGKNTGRNTAKNLLQEYWQKATRETTPSITYSISSAPGNKFIAMVTLPDGSVHGGGKACASKKKAEQSAAFAALEALELVGDSRQDTVPLGTVASTQRLDGISDPLGLADVIAQTVADLGVGLELMKSVLRNLSGPLHERPRQWPEEVALWAYINKLAALPPHMAFPPTGSGVGETEFIESALSLCSITEGWDEAEELLLDGLDTIGDATTPEYLRAAAHLAALWTKKSLPSRKGSVKGVALLLRSLRDLSLVRVRHGKLPKRSTLLPTLCRRRLIV